MLTKEGCPIRESWTLCACVHICPCSFNRLRQASNMPWTSLMWVLRLDLYTLLSHICCIRLKWCHAAWQVKIARKASTEWSRGERSLTHWAIKDIKLTYTARALIGSTHSQNKGPLNALYLEGIMTAGSRQGEPRVATWEGVCLRGSAAAGEASKSCWAPAVCLGSHHLQPRAGMGQEALPVPGKNIKFLVVMSTKARASCAVNECWWPSLQPCTLFDLDNWII